MRKALRSGTNVPHRTANVGKIKNVKYWLMKSEPDECSIDDVLAAKGRITPWSGVRNYQARNFMRDQMRVGDGVLFYHSSCEIPGIAGLAEVATAAYPDESQFDKKSPYYDPASKRDAPRWYNVDVRALRKTRLLPLSELREQKGLAGMRLLRPGNRLSITPVSAQQWRLIGKLLA
jgi:predicted RNA-binding protein with PUA-like domain